METYGDDGPRKDGQPNFQEPLEIRAIMTNLSHLRALTFDAVVDSTERRPQVFGMDGLANRVGHNVFRLAPTHMHGSLRFQLVSLRPPISGFPDDWVQSHTIFLTSCTFRLSSSTNNWVEEHCATSALMRSSACSRSLGAAMTSRRSRTSSRMRRTRERSETYRRRWLDRRSSRLRLSRMTYSLLMLPMLRISWWRSQCYFFTPSQFRNQGVARR
jgi:hypothetical protein